MAMAQSSTLKVRESTGRVNKENYHRLECSYGAFLRSFQLPENVVSDEANASVKDVASLLRLDPVRISSLYPDEVRRVLKIPGGYGYHGYYIQ